VKVLVIGHPIKADKMKSVIEKYEDTTVNIIPVYTIEDIDNLLGEIANQIEQSDIVLSSGEITYRRLSKKIILSDKVGYIPKNNETLLRALLEAKNHGYDIKRISIDSYVNETVLEVFSEVGIPEKDIFIKCYDPDIFDEDIIVKQFRFHEEQYKRNKVSCCLTGVSDVFEMLKEINVPVVMINATNKIIKDSFDRIKLEKLLNDKIGNDLVFIVVDTNIPDESLSYENDYQLVLERISIAKQIFLFSQSINAAIEEINLRRYVMVTKYKNLIEETKHFENIKLFNMIHANTMSSLSMGIGFGDTAREARHNAHMGLRKARRKEVSCAYVVYSKTNIDGPFYKYTEPEDEPVVDELFLRIAEKSGLSVNTIFKLNSIIQRYEKDTFTINELSKISGISLRSMYRIVEKLENAKIITDVGKKMKGASGRPGRLLKIKFK